MALAFLDLAGWDRGRLRFTIDTGTNSYYQLKVGRRAGQRDGFAWLDDVYLTTPIRKNDAGGSLLKTTKDVAIPATRFDHDDIYVQLVSYKTPDGKAAAYSRVVRVPSAPNAVGLPGMPLTPTLSLSTSMSTTDTFQTPRRIPCPHSPDEYAEQASIEDVLGQIIKAAGPVVLDLLGNKDKAGAAGAGKPGESGDSGSPAGILSFLLKTLLGGLGGASPAGGTPGKVVGQSLSIDTTLAENRFAMARNTQLAKPFIFGIDDALIGTVLGPFIKILPELANAANQGRIQEKQADNKLVTDALSEVNRRMLMEQLLQAKQNQPDLNQLLQMLQQAQASAAGPSKGQSLSLGASLTATPSNRAALAFVAADALPFNGTPRLLFVKGHDLEFKLRFTVAAPVPKAPLPRAIVTLTFKCGKGEQHWVTVTLKQRNVAANSVLTLSVPKSDADRLPAHKVIPVIAEIRWPSSGGHPVSATGSTEIVLVDKYFMRERGQAIPGERELTDMSRFRAFWNKIWEAPSLGSAGGDQKRLWALDADARYLVLVSPERSSNGLMETKLKATPDDTDSLTSKTEGKMKAGIELSVTEVNKLCSLWDGQSPLDADHLAAFKSHSVARAANGEFLTNIKLRGRAAERAMVYVVPVFQLIEFTLGKVEKIDDCGQVIAASDEKVRFPMAVAARVLGLKSSTGGY